MPERVIRLEFGNNPDTSKALRYLVTEERIIRAGLGGRRDPFSYTISMTPPKSSPQSSQENGESLQSSLLRSLTTPKSSKNALSRPDLASAAAAAGMLTAPSTVKGPNSPEEIREDLLSKMKVSKRPWQPRLSFGEAVSTPHMAVELDSRFNRLPLATLSPMKERPAVVDTSSIREEKKLDIGAQTCLPGISSLHSRLDSSSMMQSPFVFFPGMPASQQANNQVPPAVQNAAHAAYLMQLHAQILWQQSLVERRERENALASQGVKCDGEAEAVKNTAE